MEEIKKAKMSDIATAVPAFGYVCCICGEFIRLDSGIGFPMCTECRRLPVCFLFWAFFVFLSYFDIWVLMNPEKSKSSVLSCFVLLSSMVLTFVIEDLTLLTAHDRDSYSVL